MAERSSGWEEQGGILAQISVLRERASAAAHDVAVGYYQLVEALDAAVAGPLAGHSSTALSDRLVSTADVLIKIAETACDCACWR